MDIGVARKIVRQVSSGSVVTTDILEAENRVPGGRIWRSSKKVLAGSNWSEQEFSFLFFSPSPVSCVVPLHITS